MDLHRILRQYFELAQDLVVAALCAVVLAVMAETIWSLARLAFSGARDAALVLSQIVLILILVELFRTLLFYLSEHRVSVSLMLEVAIVSELREILLNPPSVVNAQQVYSNATLLLVLGVLLLADRYLSRQGRLLHLRERDSRSPA